MRSLLGKIAREPFVHFLVLGGLIFAADAVLNPPRKADPHRIEITDADIDRIRALYTRQWGAAPRAEDMPNLIDSYVRSEVLFREGTSLGLATDDSVLRNRVVQKMELMLQGAISVEQPTDAEITAYFQAHADRYRIPEQVAFTQIYFSKSLRGDRAAADAGAALAAIRRGEQSPPGDPFILGDDPAPKPLDAIAKDYGASFAAALSGLPEGSWQGPIASSFGLHLVRITSRQPAHLPELAEIRDRVHDDLMAERLGAATEDTYARVRAKYQVVVKPAATKPGTPVAAGTQ
jgi:hypothetical protein